MDFNKGRKQPSIPFMTAKLKKNACESKSEKRLLLPQIKVKHRAGTASDVPKTVPLVTIPLDIVNRYKPNQWGSRCTQSQTLNSALVFRKNIYGSHSIRAANNNTRSTTTSINISFTGMPSEQTSTEGKSVIPFKKGYIDPGFAEILKGVLPPVLEDRAVGALPDMVGNSDIKDIELLGLQELKRIESSEAFTIPRKLSIDQALFLPAIEQALSRYQYGQNLLTRAAKLEKVTCILNKNESIILHATKPLLRQDEFRRRLFIQRKREPAKKYYDLRNVLKWGASNFYQP